MNDWTVGSMCSGIGGLELGLEVAGMTTIWQCEIDPYASAVLAKHWPDVPNHGDIKTIDWSTVARPRVICAGYPCQPFSQAGRRRGVDDPRHLWPFVADAIRSLRPEYVVLENVSAHLRCGFDVVLADLAALGFDADWSIVSACAVGAPHTRERLFVLAYAQGDDGASDGAHHPRPSSQRGMEHRGSGRSPRSDRWLLEPDVDRVAHGVPRRLVNPALVAVGNAVVPEVAELVGRRLIGASA
jgi:DNA (cytosine-5)-methyltransferase 1